MLRIIKETIILFVLIILIAFIANSVSPKRIPYIGTWYDNRDKIALDKPPSYDPDYDSLLTMEDAFYLWKSGDAVFIDARDKSEYNSGHISGAINLPFEHWDNYWDYVSSLITPQTKIVTYCGGYNCELSVDAARELKVLGYPNTYIFFNGYDKWLELNLPRETSSEE
ncbi:MAG: hypothetical protein DRP26_04060 [Candidatus Zixiibacteriota bacterium]|nr:MAG: hypothetical protein DRP26_04060 [candidate division Zixibacteria bacterium]